MIKTIVEESPKNIAIMDVFSKLIQERIIFIDGDITPELANEVIAQMLYLNSINKNTIHIYINSDGGTVMDGLAIYDISKIIESPVRTVCIGKACSMGALLLLMGNERCALKHSRVMLHQVSAGTWGALRDMKVTLVEVEKLQKDIETIILENTKITNIDELSLADKWYSAEEALEAGIITKIL